MIAEAGKATADSDTTVVNQRGGLRACLMLKTHQEACTVDRSKKGYLRAEMKAENKNGPKFRQLNKGQSREAN